MSWFTELGTAIGGAAGGPIGAFIGGKLSTYAYDKSQPVQGPPTPAQTKRRNEIGALSTAVFTTYAGLKDKKIDMENQNRINASRAANDQALANQGMDLNKLRDSAEEAGFNPLTVLRATGGAGFNTNVALSAPRLSSPSFWGEFTNNYQTTLQNTANLQNTYANTAYTGILSKNSLLQSSNSRAQMDAINAWGNKIAASNVSDAEEWERRYGDLLGSVIGIPIAISDGLKHANDTLFTRLKNKTPKGEEVFLPTYMGEVPGGTIKTTELWTLGQLSEAAMKVINRSSKAFPKKPYTN